MVKKNVVFFCVTNFCNAKCRSCSFWMTENPTFPKREDLEKTIDVLKDKLDCGFLQITGGEPLTYPYVFDLINIANKKGMITQLMTNGSLLTKDKITKLDNAGIKMVAISVDHFDEEFVSGYRGIPNLLPKIRETLRDLKKTSIISEAGITITRYNMNELEKIADYAIDIGFDEIYFCLPVKNTNSSYKLGNEGYNVMEITDEEMALIIKRLIKLKKKLGYKISHRITFLKGMLNYYECKKQKYPCKGGERIFYLDNDLMLYQCMMKDTQIGNIFGDIKPFKKVNCYQCSIQCFREGSMYLYGIKSIPYFIEQIFNKNYWKLLGNKN